MCPKWNRMNFKNPWVGNLPGKAQNTNLRKLVYKLRIFDTFLWLVFNLLPGFSSFYNQYFNSHFNIFGSWRSFLCIATAVFLAHSPCSKDDCSLCISVDGDGLWGVYHSMGSRKVWQQCIHHCSSSFSSSVRSNLYYFYGKQAYVAFYFSLDSDRVSVWLTSDDSCRWESVINHRSKIHQKPIF